MMCLSMQLKNEPLALLQNVISSFFSYKYVLLPQLQEVVLLLSNVFCAIFLFLKNRKFEIKLENPRQIGTYIHT